MALIQRYRSIKIHKYKKMAQKTVFICIDQNNGTICIVTSPFRTYNLPVAADCVVAWEAGTALLTTGPQWT
jgi:hypothetical protein